jgi:hypothetical protein
MIPSLTRPWCRCCLVDLAPSGLCANLRASPTHLVEGRNESGAAREPAGADRSRSEEIDRGPARALGAIPRPQRNGTKPTTNPASSGGHDAITAYMGNPNRKGVFMTDARDRAAAGCVQLSASTRNTGMGNARTEPPSGVPTPFGLWATSERRRRTSSSVGRDKSGAALEPANTDRSHSAKSHRGGAAMLWGATPAPLF